MQDLIFVIALVPILCIGCIYIPALLLSVLLGYVGAWISIIGPFLIGGMSLILIMRAIKNRHDIRKGNTLRNILIITVLLAAIVHGEYRTREFKQQLMGNDYVCHHQRLTYGFWIENTYDTFVFSENGKVKVYEYVCIGRADQENLPGDYVGEYDYQIVRLLGGNYLMRCNKLSYAFKARHNRPKVLYYDITSLFL